MTSQKSTGYLKMAMSHWKRIMNEDTHGLFRFFKHQNAQNTKILSGNPDGT